MARKVCGPPISVSVKSKLLAKLGVLKLEDAVAQVQEQFSFNVDNANLVFVQVKEEASEGQARAGLGPKEKQEVGKLRRTKRKATGSFHRCGEPAKRSRKQKDDNTVADVGQGLVPELFTALKQAIEEKHVNLGLAVNIIRVSREKSYMEMKREFPDVVSLDKGGPLHSVRALIDDSGKGTFQVLSKTQFSTSLVLSDGSINVKELDMLTEKFSSDYKLCHGVSPEEYQELSNNIHINVKSKTEHVFPFHRITSTRCSLWFQAPKNLRKEEKENGARCSNCKYFVRYIKRMDKKNCNTDEAALQDRLKPSSKFPITKLAPRSHNQRVALSARKRQEMAKKIKIYEGKIKSLEAELDEDQND